ncbi:MAG: ABC transporter substrate-binding protein, partial [Actinobacteria bacterium]|nr:ABC transporter substrate-binding protein [Actinomycetota bacterium]
LYTERLRAFAQAVTQGMAMNTRVPPFDDPDVRRAVNYAVDRRTASELLGESQITCQMLPPNFPGYRPYCPYTLDPQPEGVWTAPDVPKARELVEGSGATRTPVTVWTFGAEEDGFAALGRYMVSVLRDIGFPARLRRIEDGDAYFRAVSNSRTRAQIFANGWAQDYAAASNFLDLLFSCDSFVANSRFQTNYSELCDRDLDAMIERAYELQVAEPTAAGDAWADVDRAIADLAAWVPIANPVGIDFISERVTNYQHHPQWGVLLGQLSVA